MTLSDWLMICEAWSPGAHNGLWARCKLWRPAVYFLYKMACFNGVYLTYCQTNSTGILIGHKNRCLLYWYQILRWHDEKLLCCRRVKICKFTKNKQGGSQCFHLHVRAPPMVVPGWVDKRIEFQTDIIFRHFSKALWCYISKWQQNGGHFVVSSGCWL